MIQTPNSESPSRLLCTKVSIPQGFHPPRFSPPIVLPQKIEDFAKAAVPDSKSEVKISQSDVKLTKSDGQFPNQRKIRNINFAKLGKKLKGTNVYSFY